MKTSHFSSSTYDFPSRPNIQGGHHSSRTGSGINDNSSSLTSIFANQNNHHHHNHHQQQHHYHHQQQQQQGQQQVSGNYGNLNGDHYSSDIPLSKPLSSSAIVSSSTARVSSTAEGAIHKLNSNNDNDVSITSTYNDCNVNSGRNNFDQVNFVEQQSQSSQQQQPSSSSHSHHISSTQQQQQLYNGGNGGNLEKVFVKYETVANGANGGSNNQLETNKEYQVIRSTNKYQQQLQQQQQQKAIKRKRDTGNLHIN